MNKLFILMSYSAILAALVLTGIVFYWQFHTYKPIIFNNIPFPVSTKKIKSGEKLTYTTDFCKQLPLQSFVTRTFVDQILYVTQGFYTDNPLGCHIVSTEIQVPDTLDAGTYFIKISYTYQVNPLRKVTVIAETEKFEITGHSNPEID